MRTTLLACVLLAATCGDDAGQRTPGQDVGAFGDAVASDAPLFDVPGDTGSASGDGSTSPGDVGTADDATVGPVDDAAQQDSLADGGASQDTAGDAPGFADTDADSAVADADADADADAAPDTQVGPCTPPADTAALSPLAEGIPAQNLALWLRADVGLHLDSAGGVCQWDDQSARSNHFGQPNPAGRPALAESALAGRPALRFDSAAAILLRASALGIAPSAGRTFVVVAELAETPQGSQPFAQYFANNLNTRLAIEANPQHSTGRFGVYCTNNAFDGPIALDTRPRIHVLVTDTFAPGSTIASHLRYRIDGVQQGLTPLPDSPGDGTFEDFTSANRSRISPLGRVAEVIVYEGGLTTDQLVALEAYLGARYQISLGP